MCFLLVKSSDIRRKAEELPYHYMQIEDQEGLQKCLLTREMFEFLYTEKNKQILMRYWQAAGGYQVAASKYQAFLQDLLSVGYLYGYLYISWLL